MSNLAELFADIESEIKLNVVKHTSASTPGVLGGWQDGRRKACERREGTHEENFLFVFYWRLTRVLQADLRSALCVSPEWLRSGQERLA